MKYQFSRQTYFPRTLQRLVLVSALSLVCMHLGANPSLGLDIDLVAQSPETGAFPLVQSATPAPFFLDSNDYPGVIRAAKDLQVDVERVTGVRPELTTSRETQAAKTPAIIGTIGKSSLIDQLIQEKKLDVSEIQGQWESFIIVVVDNPMANVDQALVIAGSDKRGTIYGIYEISEQIGVSPWYWWADVPTDHSEELFVRAGRHVQGPPAVKYRGIFINDEEPCLGSWAREKFGGVNSKMYAHMFELILRLRGNYLWPAMWGKAFNEDDPESPRLADEFGIVMGTSHHEPMMRAQAEWTKHRNGFGNGQWNYDTNGQGLNQFWEDGIRRNKGYENLVTIGMRGDGDEPMIEGGNMEANVALLERIVDDQRKLLSEIINPDVTKVPQMWALYKEVADYYNHGMRVPDDVTLLWCDDNWGNIRRLPTAEERDRSGGAGIYYHLDYVGSPRCYKWINTNPLPKIWEQMNMAYEYGADRIWIVNVGDLKPMEIPIEFFLRMAWSPKAMTKESIGEFTQKWAEREFGADHAAAIADIVTKYAKYNGWRKPELLEPDTYSMVNYSEAERVLAAWQTITTEAEKIYDQLTPEYRDAFYELVLYPTKASATVAEMYISAGRNQLYAAQGRASANAEAGRVRELFQQDKELTESYHQLADGKWNHMMAQTHIGYTSWRDPQSNIMPKVTEVTPAQAASLGVAIEGAKGAWPDETETAVLPAFDSLNRQSHWITVFNRGLQNLDYSIEADQSWVKLGKNSGRADQDQRVWIDIDWEKIPVGENSAVVTVSRSKGESVPIQLHAVRSAEYTLQNSEAFGGLTGPVAIAAENATHNIAAGDVRWEKIPDYGRGSSGMAVFPVTAESVLPPGNAPRMEYPVFIPEAGEIHVDMVTGPTLNVQPDRGVRIAVSFDDQPPQIVDAFAGQSYADPSKRGDPSAPPIRSWHDWVRNNARILNSTHQISHPGMHTLKIWMVDPGIVLEKLIVHRDPLPDSYFGPPENSLN